MQIFCLLFLASPSVHAWFLFCIFIAEPQIKIIISSENWFNYVVTFFFLKMPKIWVGQTTLNGEKKEDGRSGEKLIVCFPMSVLRENIIHLTVKFCFRYFEV